MNGVRDFYKNGKINELHKGLDIAIKNRSSLSTKIDGAPAVIMWSEFPGIEGPGVGFKTLPKQLEKGIPKDYFTTEQEIVDFMNSKDLDENVRDHRTKAFINALRYLAPNLEEGRMFQGDVLFASSDELTHEDQTWYCKPNTIEYGFDDKQFNFSNKEFGICIHTAVNDAFNYSSIIDFNLKSTEAYIFTKKDFDIDDNVDLTKASRELADAWDDYNSDVKNLLNNNVLRILKKADKHSNAPEETIKNLDSNKVSVEDFSAIVNNMYAFNQTKEDIISQFWVKGVKSYVNNRLTHGEGFVVTIAGSDPLKLVSDTEFTAANIAHIHSMHESRLIEQVQADGEYMTAWSSSKTPDLFKHYFNKDLNYGNGGGSNYGFATYLVTEPPFSKAAAVGYSDDYRKKLYGDNIFQFDIKTEKVLFFTYSDFLKTTLGMKTKANIEDFIKVQIENMKINLTPEELSEIQITDPNANASNQAYNFFKIMSRYFYQGRRGNLRTPCDGFEYKGKNDGNTLVVWNSHRLLPKAFSNDNGTTWQKCDEDSKEYKDYLKAAELDDHDYHLGIHKNSIYDGNQTPEKTQIYRLLMAYNSNDDSALKSKLADGIFFNIVIHDNKKIDASFKYNLPYVDDSKHFFRLRKNEFIDKIHSFGYSFGKLNCGIKIGGDAGKDWNIDEVPEYYWPDSCTGEFKLVSQNVDNYTPKCDVETKTLNLRNCNIVDSNFDYWNKVIFSTSKPSYAATKEIYDAVVSKFGKQEGFLPPNPTNESLQQIYNRIYVRNKKLNNIF